MSTVDPIELVWTAAALPGLVLWNWNGYQASRSLRAARKAWADRATIIVARHSVFQAGVMVWLSLGFGTIGVVSLLRPPSPDTPHWDWLRVLLTVVLLTAPAAISLLGWRWRWVEQQVLALAKARHNGREDAGDT